eukprot:COSAG06_NODE_1525_length_9196_cov_253.607343_2_plen_150_part_00
MSLSTFEFYITIISMLELRSWLESFRDGAAHGAAPCSSSSCVQPGPKRQRCTTARATSAVIDARHRWRVQRRDIRAEVFERSVRSAAAAHASSSQMEPRRATGCSSSLRCRRPRSHVGASPRTGANCARTGRGATQGQLVAAWWSATAG